VEEKESDHPTVTAFQKKIEVSRLTTALAAAIATSATVAATAATATAGRPWLARARFIHGQGATFQLRAIDL
jgi:hypothetical protein